jgi:hypothetical protein
MLIDLSFSTVRLMRMELSSLHKGYDTDTDQVLESSTADHSCPTSHCADDSVEAEQNSKGKIRFIQALTYITFHQ